MRDIALLRTSKHWKITLGTHIESSAGRDPRSERHFVRVEYLHHILFGPINQTQPTHFARVNRIAGFIHIITFVCIHWTIKEPLFAATTALAIHRPLNGRAHECLHRHETAITEFLALCYWWYLQFVDLKLGTNQVVSALASYQRNSETASKWCALVVTDVWQFACVGRRATVAVRANSGHAGFARAVRTACCRTWARRASFQCSALQCSVILCFRPQKWLFFQIAHRTPAHIYGFMKPTR